MSLKVSFFASFTIVIVSLLIGTCAYAEQFAEVPYKTERMKALPSTTEDIGMAFFSLAGVTPDFETLVRLSKNLEALDEPARTDYLNKEPLRLEQKFTSFSPSAMPLVFRIPLPVRFIPNRDGTSQLKIDFYQGSDSSFYLPFYYAQKPIAVLIHGVETFETINLNVTETQIVAGKLGPRPVQTVLIEVYAIKADAKQSITLDGIKQYPLLTQIGYIGIVNSSAEQVWAWESDISKDASRSIADDIRNLQPAK